MRILKTTVVMVIVMWFGGQLVLSEQSILSPQEFIGYILIFSQIIPPRVISFTIIRFYDFFRSSFTQNITSFLTALLVVGEFRSEFSTLGLSLKYDFKTKSIFNPFISFGLQGITFKTLNDDISSQYSAKETGLVIPVGAGVTLKMSDRMSFDASLNYALSLLRKMI